ncbi:helix-turn-helix transcriptional regulator [Pseudonocardia halophobica]|uniref:helix-turn-helix transcriptional regulator n=1 Tax=Pseudonocardia halophobica TaxID=29401 RepID=UPI003D8FB776
MRADRLLSLVLLLRHRGRMTAPAIARELEVSTRTVLRDVEALSAAGIPVYAERGRHGGFALLPGFSTDLTGLTPDEAVALLTSPARATSDALGLGEAFSSAIRKVVTALPEGSREAATDATGRVLVRRGGFLHDAPETPAADALHTVQRAVFTGHRLRIRYAARGAEEGRWRTVDPLGLVEAAGAWYLLALHDGADRTYRISRIEAAEELDEPAQRPTGVDLEELWQRRRDEFRRALPHVVARIRVREQRRAELTRTALTVTDAENLGTTEDTDGADGEVGEVGEVAEHGWTDQDVEAGGWSVVTAAFGDLRHAIRVVWSLAPDAEALHPPELATALRTRAEAVVAAHRP